MQSLRTIEPQFVKFQDISNTRKGATSPDFPKRSSTSGGTHYGKSVFWTHTVSEDEY